MHLMTFNLLNDRVLSIDATPERPNQQNSHFQGSRTKQNNNYHSLQDKMSKQS